MAKWLALLLLLVWRPALAVDCRSLAGYSASRGCVPTLTASTLPTGRQLYIPQQCQCDYRVPFNANMTTLNTACIEGEDCTADRFIAPCGTDDCGVSGKLNTSHPAKPDSGKGCLEYWFTDHCKYMKCESGPYATAAGTAGKLVFCEGTTTTTSSTSTSSSTSSTTSVTNTTSTTSTSTSSTSTTSTSSSTTSSTSTTISGQNPVAWCAAASASIACWHFEAISGTRVAETSNICAGGVCDMAVQLGSVTSNGNAVFGTRAALFDGESELACDAVGCATEISVGATSQYLQCWFAPTNDVQNTQRLFNSIGNTQRGMGIHWSRISPTYGFEADVGNDTSTIAAADGSPNQCPVGVYCAAGVLYEQSGDAGTVTVYVNGHPLDTQTVPAPGMATATVNPEFGSCPNCLIGNLDECVYVRGRPTDATICRLARCGPNGERCRCDGGTPANYKSCTDNNDCLPSGICAETQPGSGTKTCSGYGVGRCVEATDTTTGADAWCDADADCPGSNCVFCTLPACNQALP